MKVERGIFALAAATYFGIALGSAYRPDLFFVYLVPGTPLEGRIWAALFLLLLSLGGMLAYAAWRPLRGRQVAWFAMANAIVITSGWMLGVTRERLPAQSYPLLIATSLVWFFPWLWCALAGSQWRRSAVLWAGAAMHVAACYMLLTISQGQTATLLTWNERMGYDLPRWLTTWVFWTLSSLSLPVMLAVWAGSWARAGAARTAAIAALLLVAVGVCCDVFGETMLITRATKPDLDAEAFAAYWRWYELLGMGWANGLYCVGGLALSVMAWRRGQPRGVLGAVGIACWLTGLAISAAVASHNDLLKAWAGAATMALFLPWSVCLGWVLREETAKLATTIAIR